ncbi:hypothetical protein Tsubulata_022976 [Turnera subulata]|uniref:NAC domain-containing protein n=1 Tax=Turnera subulata TaxID=218843 RepID=A0A9Q0J9T4_9ROSI|nr:hypothetical protein Tsubulata_022976 [Turnera subulata]
MQFPVPPEGYVFSPKEEELLGYYLRRRVNGQPLPQGVINECDVYGDKNPWEIFREIIKPNSSSSSSSSSDDQSFYVFTRLKKRKRTTGCGFWKQQSTETIPTQYSNSVLGRKRIFVFEAKTNKDKKINKKISNKTNGHWIMKEYSLPDHYKDQSFVLCQIYDKEAKDAKKKKKKKRNDDDSPAASDSCNTTTNHWMADEITCREQDHDEVCFQINQTHDPIIAIDHQEQPPPPATLPQEETTSYYSPPWGHQHIGQHEQNNYLLALDEDEIDAIINSSHDQSHDPIIAIDQGQFPILAPEQETLSYCYPPLGGHQHGQAEVQNYIQPLEVEEDEVCFPIINPPPHDQSHDPIIPIHQGQPHPPPAPAILAPQHQTPSYYYPPGGRHQHEQINVLPLEQENGTTPNMDMQERPSHHVLQPQFIRACDVFPERFSTPLFRNMDLKTFMALDASLNQIIGEAEVVR